MSTVALCAFCEALPERQSANAIKTIRCPLCRTDLGIASSGAKFRIGAAVPHASHRSRSLAVLGGFAACALVGLALFILFRSDNLPEPPPVPPDPTPVVAESP